MNRWIFLRHGESVANQNRVFSGHEDVDLTDKGIRQAMEAGPTVSAILNGDPINQVLSSDLQRARKTAQLVIQSAGLHNHIEQSPALRERHLGAWQGRSIDELKKQGARSILHSWTGRAPNGESLAELAHRSVRFLSQVPDTSCTLLVGHGGLIRTLLGLIDGTKRSEIGKLNIPNAVPFTRLIETKRWEQLLTELSG